MANKKEEQVNIEDLKLLTNDTIKEIRKFDIVTPELFKETFLLKAKENKITIDPDELTQNTLDFTLHKVYKIEKETKANTQLLQKNIDLATEAIDHADKELLKAVQQQMEELNHRISMLEEQVYLDELTKAYNRKWLFEKFLIDEKFLKNGTLVFVDVDKFKEINDTYGHITGDKVLAMITQLTKKLKDTHTIRYGGDEFILISPHADAKHLQLQMQVLCKTLDTKLFKYQGNTFQVHISYGITMFRAGDDFQEIIGKVDQLMYAHKKRKLHACT